jgi:putative transposase
LCLSKGRTAAAGASFQARWKKLVYRREASHPNAVWQADHTPLDIELLQSELDATKTAKPWLTAILDDYSRAVAGYFLSCKSPSSLNTALALRQAILAQRGSPAGRFAGFRKSYIG